MGAHSPAAHEMRRQPLRSRSLTPRAAWEKASVAWQYSHGSRPSRQPPIPAVRKPPPLGAHHQTNKRPHDAAIAGDAPSAGGPSARPSFGAAFERARRRVARSNKNSRMNAFLPPWCARSPTRGVDVCRTRRPFPRNATCDHPDWEQKSMNNVTRRLNRESQRSR